MISTSFQYKRATSVEDALNALNQDSKILAGGHSLIPALKLRINYTDALIDITKIASLKKISVDGNNLCIGAAATHADIASNSEVKTHAALFAQVAGQIGDVQVRNAGTIGGSIAHADPAADWPAALLAADATVVIQSKSGSRQIAAADFFTGIFSTALTADELITEIRVPSMQVKKSHYEKFAQPASRFALVGCAVVADANGGNIRIAFTGVSDTPYLDKKAQQSLDGKSLTESTIASAVAAMDTTVYTMSDHYANEKYRSHLAGVMMSRALAAIS